MKRIITFVAFLLIPVLVCLSTLPPTLASREAAGGRSSSPRQGPSSPPNHQAVLVQAAKPYRQDVEKSLKRYDSLELDPEKVAQEVRRTGRFLLPTSDGAFDLSFVLNDMRAARYQAQVTLDGGKVRLLERQPVHTYKGTVAGMSGAQARFTMDGNNLEGLIITPSALYFVEPAKRYSASANPNDFLVYKGSDVITTSFGECGVTLAEEVGSEALRLKSQVPLKSISQNVVTEEVFTPPRVVDLATEADFEYFTALGSETAANNEIINIMNQVEGIYDAQFGLRFSIVFQNVFATSGDPYSSTMTPSDLLNEFRAFWTANRGAVTRDLAHLWTGRDFTGITIGIAFRPGLECPFDPAGAGYGISQGPLPAPEKFILTAHEIGHGFNATHSDSQTGCDLTIMNATLSGSTMQTFCPFSVTEIETHASSKVACLPQAITPGCNYSLSPASQFFPLGGGAGNVNVTTVGTNCVWGATSTVSWITINSGTGGTNNGTVSFTVASNSGGFARTGILRIAEQDAAVHQLGGSGCAITPINFGQPINATLSDPSDCRSSQRISSFADQYSFAGIAGQKIRIEMNAATPPPQPGGLDTYLYLLGPNGNVVAENDDIVLGDQTNSRIPQDGTLFTLPATGVYIIEATSFDVNETGDYTLTLIDNSSMNSVSFSGAPFTVTEGVDGNGVGFEGTGLRTITVTRSGADVSGAATIDYATSEGTADERRDYTKARGTLRFAPGDTSETFRIFITDDVFKPGDVARSRNNFNQFIVIESQTETINLTLSNPVGTTLGPTSTAVLTINDNDSVTGVNPVKNDTLNPRFFVRQHYNDFLGREPDLGGLNFWVDGITPCGTNLQCRKVKSIDTSAAFFLAIEFQETGFLVHRAYKAAFGDATGQAIINGVPTPIPVPIVRLNGFLPDTLRISEGVQVGIGDWQTQLENNKVAFFDEFVARAQFLTEYPLTMTPDAFVDKLNMKSGSVLIPAERNLLVSQLGAKQKTRGQIVRAVAEDGTMAQNELNRAFVLMQYLGYLRRNPNDLQDTDHSGFNFWLVKLNQFNGNFHDAEMVRAFIESIEYFERFGP